MKDKRQTRWCRPGRLPSPQIWPEVMMRLRRTWICMRGCMQCGRPESGTAVQGAILFSQGQSQSVVIAPRPKMPKKAFGFVPEEFSPNPPKMR